MAQITYMARMVFTHLISLFNKYVRLSKYLNKTYNQPKWHCAFKSFPHTTNLQQMTLISYQKKFETPFKWKYNNWIELETWWQKEKLLDFNNFFFCRHVFRKRLWGKGLKVKLRAYTGLETEDDSRQAGIWHAEWFQVPGIWHAEWFQVPGNRHWPDFTSWYTEYTKHLPLWGFRQNYWL